MTTKTISYWEVVLLIFAIPPRDYDGTQGDILCQVESASVSDDDCEHIDTDAGDEYYNDALSHEQVLQVLQLLEESDDEFNFEGF